MHENICARIVSSNQDGLDSYAAALPRRGKGGGGRLVKEKTKCKEREAGKRKLNQTAFQYVVVHKHHSVLDMLHGRE